MTFVEKILTTLTVMSLAGSIISILLLALKPLSSRIFSATWHYMASLIVIVFFLLPFSLWMTSFRIDANHNAGRITELYTQEPTVSNRGRTGISDEIDTWIFEQKATGSDDTVKIDISSLLFVAWITGICGFYVFRLRDICSQAGSQSCNPYPDADRTDEADSYNPGYGFTPGGSASNLQT